jgi:hypothetical protein
MRSADASSPTDAALLAGLGVLAAARTLEVWLEEACRERGAGTLASDDPALLAALGLLSLRRTALRWLADAAEPPRATSAPTGAAPRGLLR